MINSHETFSERLDKLFGKTPSEDAHDLSGAESRARSLIRELSDALAELRTVAYTEGDDDQKNKLIETLTQKISTRRSKLESTKDTLMRFMHAAESNAQKLESQYLNDPDSEMSLQRAAGVAWSEVKRLTKLLEEIEQALSMSASASGEIVRIRTTRGDEGDFHFTATSGEAKRMIDPPARDNRGNRVETGTLKPLLGQAAPGGLSESLKKIPVAAQGTSKIQAGLYKGGIFIENARFNNLELQYSSSHDVAKGSSSKRVTESGGVTSQGGSDGSYDANGDMGILSLSQKDNFGVW